jgi:hypothetical protein
MPNHAVTALRLLRPTSLAMENLFAGGSSPDFLALCRGPFFERDGFCFRVSLDREEVMAIFTIMFQGRYIESLMAQVALRPAGSGVATLSPLIECEAAGFGIVKFPVAIPRRHQGKRVTFEIGADVTFLQGRGREVCRVRGRSVRHDSGFHRLPDAELGVLHRFIERMVPSRPAKLRLTLPTEVAECLPDTAVGGTEMLWRLSPYKFARASAKR